MQNETTSFLMQHLRPQYHFNAKYVTVSFDVSFERPYTYKKVSICPHLKFSIVEIVPKWQESILLL